MAILKLKAPSRKVSGLEFGRIFAGQIDRKVAKHAEKHPDEPNSMDIDLNGKDLTDEGLCEVLNIVMVTLENFSNFHLEELHLGKNGLTTAVLPYLSLVVQNSSFDLRALDLFDNHIRVVTKEQAQQWEQFLNSLRTCRVMRRLDLSSNDLSDSLAMEVLCRVYFSHPHIDPNELESGALIDDDMAATRGFHSGRMVDKTNWLPSMSPEDQVQGSSAPADCLSYAVILKRREGLRSIPYIVLRNVSMTDAGAMWLSRILQHHYWPQYLMTTLKEGSHAAKLKGEDDSTQSFGIVYVDNPNITAAGQKALALAEQARVGLAGISEMSGSVKDEYEDPNEACTQSREGEMEHLRKKLQRTTIEAVRVNGVQLWAAALQLINLARAIIPPSASQTPVSPIIAAAPVPAPYETEVEEAIVETPPAANISDFPSLRPDLSDFPPLQLSLPAFPHKTLRIIATKQGRATHPPKPSRGKGLAPRSSPVKTQQPLAIARSSFSTPNNVSLITEGLRTMSMSSKPVYNPPIDQMVKRSETWPMGMHEHLWLRALGQIGRDGGILSARQVESVIKYARDRDTLAVEMEATGRARSVQIWGVLDRMECLEYEMDM